MNNTSSNDLPSNTQEYLDFLATRIQQITAAYVELEKEKQVVLSQPKPAQKQLQSLLHRLENNSEVLRTLQEQISQAIEDLRQWQKQQ